MVKSQENGRAIIKKETKLNIRENSNVCKKMLKRYNFLQNYLGIRDINYKILEISLLKHY